MKPMLSATIKDIADVQFPVMASPKFDGIRALVVDGVVMSRNLIPIPNEHVQRTFGDPRFNGLDGELICGDPWAKDCFNRTSSAVMSRDGEPAVSFVVFDNYLIPEVPYNIRWEGLPLREVIGNCELVRVASYVIHTGRKLKKLEKVIVREGYEGIMVRGLQSKYKYGRATMKGQELMKLKRFEDAEAEVIGCTPWMRNVNEMERNNLGGVKRSRKKEGLVETDMLGALRVRDLKTGVEFEIGTGFNVQQREKYWENKESLVGLIVKYKHQPAGAMERPRFPVFLGFRHPIDMSDD